MEPRISPVSLGVTDLDRAVAFYDGLSWPRRVIAAQGVAFFQLADFGLLLYSRAELAADAGVPMQSHPSQGFTLAYNTRSRDEVDEVLSRAEALGGTITQLAQNAV
ncbi:VOC family protein [Methylobacterium sp. E-046]|uniref:VOC family protein n=1 Tax=Methylobacterium sp. E-046 TaxID=2836576 RepID=UPI001FB8667E|nr:VOC family protein [Methylobacterium sp. E-046]MCJ2099770.1 VOC family protein [Methylobacterium sp. E-046]